MIIIDDLFFWLPIKGILLVVEEIHQRMGGGELSEHARLRKRLLEVRLRYEMDEISEAEYQQVVNDTLSRLRNLRNPQNEGEDHEGDTGS